MRLFEEKRPKTQQLPREHAGASSAARENGPSAEPAATSEQPRAAAGDTIVLTAKTAVHRAEEVREIPLDLVLDSPFQPRRRALTKRDLDELMRSLHATGQTAPIIVTPGTGEHAGKFYVQAGHRRCAALRMLGRTTVQAIVRPHLDERSTRRIVLGDNLGRDDLTAYEQAVALRDYRTAFALSVEDAANELGIKTRTAFRLNAILDVSAELQEVLRDEAIGSRAAEALAKVDAHDVRKAVRLARKHAAGSITVQALEAEVQKVGAEKGARRVAKDVELKLEGDSIHLKLALNGRERTPAQVERALEAMGQVLRQLGIARLEARQPPR